MCVFYLICCIGLDDRPTLSADTFDVFVDI